MISLRETLSRRPRRQIVRGERAAVLVAILDDGGPLRLLLTRRTAEVATHKGQVAFPGGLACPDDDGPVRTALREAQEEIGLRPEAVEVLGLLDDVPTRTDAVAVTPVVGRLATLPHLTPHDREVARIFTVPLADLQRPERWTSRLEDRPGGARHVHYFEHDGETLWGLSARIVLNLLELTPPGSPVALQER
ncbi:MAG TPA: CoA pyrophosphatase [Candidatus Polarisedimenticolia bacterium]|nr:CoA pyrophosphatase [Candidatus Polarisedimenticolia bacterium]